MNIINAIEKALEACGADADQIEKVSATQTESLQFCGKSGWRVDYSTKAMLTFDPGFNAIEVTDAGDTEIADII